MLALVDHGDRENQSLVVGDESNYCECRREELEEVQLSIFWAPTP